MEEAPRKRPVVGQGDQPDPEEAFYQGQDELNRTFRNTRRNVTRAKRVRDEVRTEIQELQQAVQRLDAARNDLLAERNELNTRLQLALGK